mmetsp:Transcript_27706/g.42777  ORF Transcript_27706/g.42777 Transcript_27706/m.42777 type:complete len:351 (+) Transcript_27706:152-1204(+)
MLQHSYRSTTTFCSNIVHRTPRTLLIVLISVLLAMFDPVFTSAQTTDPPTYIPTYPPTESPTVRPTRYPTERPTNPPTKLPTFRPTRSPTDRPSYPPTKTPTTDTPTPIPTKLPTHIPTGAPTKYLTTPPSSPGFVASARLESGSIDLIDHPIGVAALSCAAAALFLSALIALWGSRRSEKYRRDAWNGGSDADDADSGTDVDYSPDFSDDACQGMSFVTMDSGSLFEYSESELEPDSETEEACVPVQYLAPRRGRQEIIMVRVDAPPSAPPGFTLEVPRGDGPLVVRSVDPAGPLTGLMETGDTLLAIDDESVTADMGVAEVSESINRATREGREGERAYTVARRVKPL